MWRDLSGLILSGLIYGDTDTVAVDAWVDVINRIYQVHSIWRTMTALHGQHLQCRATGNKRGGDVLFYHNFINNHPPDLKLVSNDAP